MKILLPGQIIDDCHYAGIATAGKRHWHLLVPVHQDLPKMAWGEYGQGVPGAKSRFDGYENTLAMAEAGSKLAQIIRTIPGDCYLPGQAEITLCAATIPQVFKDGYHWSSTQLSRHDAFVQSFEYGGNYWGYQGNEFRAAVVKRIMIGE